MRSLKRVFFVLITTLLMVAILAFVLENQQSVSLLFLGLAGPQLPVSIIVMFTLLIGMMIGPLLSWLVNRTTRKQP